MQFDATSNRTMPANCGEEAGRTEEAKEHSIGLTHLMPHHDEDLPEDEAGLAPVVSVHGLLERACSTNIATRSDTPQPLLSHLLEPPESSVGPTKLQDAHDPGLEAVSLSGGSCIRWRSSVKNLVDILASRPFILAVSTLVLVACLSIGVTAVLITANHSIQRAKVSAQQGLGVEVASGISQAVDSAAFGVQALTSFVRLHPNRSELEADKFALIANELRGWDAADAALAFDLNPAGLIWVTDPPRDVTSNVKDADLLRDPYTRDVMLYAISLKDITVLGPYFSTGTAETLAYTISPIFLPAPDEHYDWGFGAQPYNCSICWDPVKKIKYWGHVTSLVNLTPLIRGTSSGVTNLVKQGYLYRLWQEETSIASLHYELVASSRLPKDPVVNTIKAFNIIWHLELEPAEGWAPKWRGPCIAAVVVGSLLMAVLVMWLLVSREQHKRLLRAMLPGKVIRQLAAGQRVCVEEFDTVTILFSDIVSYTAISASLTPRQVVSLLNELYSCFDELTQKHGVYKVETIGDAFMCVTGCPVAEDPVLAVCRMAAMAQDMVRCVAQFVPSVPGLSVKIRVGLHSGPVVAGVVGKKMPRYCLFGDTVNTASRMESTSEPMSIQVSPSTAALLQQSKASERFELQPRGEVQVKGKGAMATSWLLTNGERAFGMEISHPGSLLPQQAQAGTATVAVPSGGAGGAASCTFSLAGGAGAGGGGAAGTALLLTGGSLTRVQLLRLMQTDDQLDLVIHQHHHQHLPQQQQENQQQQHQGPQQQQPGLPAGSAATADCNNSGGGSGGVVLKRCATWVTEERNAGACRHASEIGSGGGGAGRDRCFSNGGIHGGASGGNAVSVGLLAGLLGRGAASARSGSGAAASAAGGAAGGSKHGDRGCIAAVSVPLAHQVNAATCRRASCLAHSSGPSDHNGSSDSHPQNHSLQHPQQLQQPQRPTRSLDIAAAPQQAVAASQQDHDHADSSCLSRRSRGVPPPTVVLQLAECE